MFDDHTNQITGNGRSRQINGISPETLSDEDKREIRDLARNMKEETKRYLPSEYTVGVRNYTVDENIVLNVEIICPTGDVIELNAIPTRNDISDEKTKSDTQPHKSISKDFVAQTITALLTQNRTTEQRSIPAS